MPSLGTLEYEIGANTRKFLGEMQKVDSRLKQTAFAMRKGINTAGKYSAAFAAAGFAIGATLVKAQLSAIDSTAKFADTVGLTTEQLTGLRHAAAITGVSANELDTGIRRMEKNISDASNGLSTAVRVFDDLGVSIQDIRKLSPDEQIKVIADSFGSVPNQADKARIAQDLFGRSGIKLIKTMELGSAGIAELQAEAVKLGIAYSRVDAAQVEAANDAITRAQSTLSAVAQKVTVELAPTIQAVADEFTKVMLNSEGMGQSIINAFEGATTIVGVFADGIHGIKIIAGGVGLVFQTMGASVLTVASTVAEGWTRIFALITAGLKKAIGFANKIPGVDIPTSGLDAFQDKMDGAAATMVGFREQLALNVQASAEDLQNLAMQPLSSQGLKQFVADVKASSEKARAEMQLAAEQAARAPKVPEGGEGGKEKLTADQEKEREEMQARLDRIAEEFATEKQLEMIHHADRMKFLESAKQSELGLTGKFDKLIENEKERHASKLREISFSNMSMIASDQAGFLQSMLAATKQSGMAQVSTMAGAFEQISAAGARENKKLFQVNKIAGIANATISTFTGAAKALELGPIAGPIAAAAIIANGLAKVQAIKSQSFSSGSSAGGGGNVAPSIAASSPAQPVSNVGGGGSRQSISIRFSGGNENQRSAIRDFAEQLNDFMDDGGEVGRFAFE